MPEGYTTLAETTLASGYTAGSGTMALTSGAAFPASGLTFSIRANTTGAIYTCTRSSNTLTVTLESGSDVNLSSGASIVAVITARALTALFADQNQIGVLASRPATPQRRCVYYATDAFYSYIWNGSLWVPCFNGLPVDEPLVASFTLEGSGGGTSTTDDTHGGIIFTMPGVSIGDSVKWLVKTPDNSPPYTLIVGFTMPPTYSTGNNFAGPGLRESGTQKGAVLCYRGVDNLALITVSNDTSWSGGISGTARGPSPVYWMKITNDGTDLKFYLGGDRFNLQHLAAYDVSVASRFTVAPDQIGFALQTEDANLGATVSIVHFEELVGV